MQQDDLAVVMLRVEVKVRMMVQATPRRGQWADREPVGNWGPPRPSACMCTNTSWPHVSTGRGTRPLSAARKPSMPFSLVAFFSLPSSAAHMGHRWSEQDVRSQLVGLPS